MNPQVKKKWIDALRSGHYKQGFEVLRYEEDKTYCCLGVLSDLYFQSHQLEWDYFPSEELPCNRVCKWAGIDSNPTVITKTIKVGIPVVMKNSLAEFNDEGHSFEEIANLIEEQL